jgi:hypothetical protein
MTDHLCKDCEKLNIKGRLHPAQHLFFASNETISVSHVPISSADTICALCQLLADWIEYERRKLPEHHDSRLSSSKCLQELNLEFRLHGWTKTLEGSNTDSYCMIVSYRGITIRIIPLGEDAFRVGCRKQSFARSLNLHQADRDILREWMSTCQGSHKGACRHSDLDRDLGQILPKLRLVDVVNECVQGSE